MRRTLLTLCLALLAANAWADAILINDVRIFNGVDAELARGNVLVVDGVIKNISNDLIEAPDDATVIASQSSSPGPASVIAVDCVGVMLRPLAAIVLLGIPTARPHQSTVARVPLVNGQGVLACHMQMTPVRADRHLSGIGKVVRFHECEG